jgi:hypothetical protein
MSALGPMQQSRTVRQYTPGDEAEILVIYGLIAHGSRSSDR